MKAYGSWRVAFARAKNYVIAACTKECLKACTFLSISSSKMTVCCITSLSLSSVCSADYNVICEMQKYVQNKQTTVP